MVVTAATAMMMMTAAAAASAMMIITTAIALIVPAIGRVLAFPIKYLGVNGENESRSR
jgi:hypothetical protein